MREKLRLIVGPAIALALALAVLAPSLTAWAGPAEQVTVNNGTVIGLQGTPHIFIGDANGVLHWGGDTRALANIQGIDWNNRRDVSLDVLRSLRRGDPYLSAGLLKIGDPIYLVKWETNWTQPILLHIQSIADVELFGINATNYGNFVMDKTTWEQKFGLSSDPFVRGELVPATAPAPTATPVATATVTSPLSLSLVKVERTGQNEFKTTIRIQDTPGVTVKVKLVGREYVYCRESCGSGEPTNYTEWGPLDGGATNSDGKLDYVDTHGAYKSYTYTVTDSKGNTASIDVGDDTQRGLTYTS